MFADDGFLTELFINSVIRIKTKEQLAGKTVSFRSAKSYDRYRCSYNKAADQIDVVWEGVNANEIPEHVYEDRIFRHKEEIEGQGNFRLVLSSVINNFHYRNTYWRWFV